jgi:hypothetical protein
MRDQLIDVDQFLHSAFLDSERPRGVMGTRAAAAGRLPDPALKEEHRDERVDRERFGKAEADDHGDLELRQNLRLAAHRLQGTLAQEADSDARPDGREADSDRKSES